MKALEVSALSKIFNARGIRSKKILALQDISFSLEKGQLLGVMGPNGSGKSTLFKCILGFLWPTSGNITVFENLYSPTALKTKVGFLYERVNFYPELTPVELLEFYGKLYAIPRVILKNRIEELLHLVDLFEFKDVRVRGFSKGMTQRLGIASALIQDAELLIFDEPTTGLDLFGVAKIKEIIKKLREKGKTLIVSSHLLSHIQDLCDQHLVLFKGKILSFGSWQNLVCNQNVFQVDLKIHKGSEIEKALQLLKENGFSVTRSGFSPQDFEEKFLKLFEDKNHAQ
jgi:ABC-2 type transport system ATP-binding protein